MDILRLNWEATLRYCEELAAEARRFKPDMIVGLSRGGLVPARILSDLMEVREIGILGISFYKGVGKTADSPRITQELTMDLKGKRILVVDDVADTGKSLIVAKDYLLRKGAKEIKVATIHFKPKSAFKPDYYAETTTSWVVYPWEQREMEKELKKG
jgi:uncharacterized protein